MYDFMADAEQPAAVEPEPQVEAEQQNQTTKTEDDHSVPEEKTEVKNESEKPATEAISPPVDNASVTKEKQSAQTVRSDIKQEPSARTVKTLPSLCAKDIMQKDILWCSSD